MEHTKEPGLAVNATSAIKADQRIKRIKTSGPHPNNYRQTPTKPEKGGKFADFMDKDNPSHKLQRERRNMMAKAKKSQEKRTGG